MTGTASFALALVAIAVFAAASMLVARRRRRRAGTMTLDPLPAGIKHLASHVGALSSFGVGLRLPPQRQGLRRAGSHLGAR